MKNKLSNLYDALTSGSGSSVSRLQIEGLGSNIQICADKTAVITLLTEQIPSPGILSETEEIFIPLLQTSDVFFSLVTSDRAGIDHSMYLQWAACHIARSNPFEAAIVRNSELTLTQQIGRPAGRGRV